MRMCRINHTLKLITRPYKALRIAIVRLSNIMKIYLVLIDNGGAHTPDNITSVWSTLELAKQEAENINEENKNSKYPSSVRAGVKMIELDKSYDCVHDY